MHHVLLKVKSDYEKIDISVKFNACTYIGIYQTFVNEKFMNTKTEAYLECERNSCLILSLSLTIGGSLTLSIKITDSRMAAILSSLQLLRAPLGNLHQC